MRKIGLLGGMSFEGSIAYYRLINEGVRDALGGQNSVPLTLRSVNFEEIVQMQQGARWEEAGRYLADAAKELEQSGAECVLMCCVTMYIVGDAIERALSVPFINIIDVTAESLTGAGYRRPLLIATRYTMENGFYQERAKRNGVEVMVPDADGRTVVHSIIFDELCKGKVISRSREKLVALIDKAKSDGADSVIFGCTEIGMILDPAALPLPAFDSTVVHAKAATTFALGD